MPPRPYLLVTSALLALLSLTMTAQAANVRVTITNNAPGGGTYQTPLWVGFHDGSFDTFNAGSAASSALEALAEDGNTAPLGTLLGGAGLSGQVGAAPLAPGASASADFTLAGDGSNSFLSFASMVLPSSDFFIGNDNPLALSLAGVLDGTFSKASFDVIAVYDAGTEVNDFATSAGNGLFGIAGGQSGPNQGADQNGFVTLASAGAYTLFLNAGGVDTSGFNFDGYASLATIEVEAIAAPVPLPAALPLIASALAGVGFGARRRALRRA